MCSVYDMVDNFSLVAEWQDTSNTVICCFTFHNNQNNELIVVFHDSVIALMSLSRYSKDGTMQANINLQHNGALAIKQKFRVLDEDTRIKKLCFVVFNHAVETWVCVWDIAIRNTFTLCSIKHNGFRKLQIKSNSDIVPVFVYCSIPQKAVMLAKMSNKKPWNTRIWIDLDFDDEINTQPPIELSNRQGFDFRNCGSYFVTWNYSERGENAIDVYDVRVLKTSTRPIARRSIGHDVLTARGQFVRVDQALLDALGYMRLEESLIVAFLVASSRKVELTLWDIFPNEVLKKIDLTMKEVIPLFNQSIKLIHAILDDIFRTISH